MKFPWEKFETHTKFTSGNLWEEMIW